jgi:hypothetical protein
MADNWDNFCCFNLRDWRALTLLRSEFVYRGATIKKKEGYMRV